MSRTVLSVFALLTMAGGLNAATRESEFCRAVKTLPLENYEETVKRIHGQGSVRTSENSTGDGRSLDDIKRVVAPYALSPALQEIFVDNADGGESDYNVYRSKDDKVFIFTDVQGSMKCDYDIWAIRNATTLDVLPDGPDLGETCNTVRIYGVIDNSPVLIQYVYHFNEADGLMAQTDKIEDIRAVKLLPDTLNEVCVIKPE